MTAFLYLLVFERDALRAVSQGAPLSTLVGAVLGGDPSSSEAQEPTEPNPEISEGQTGATEEQPAEADLIKVVAIRSKAQEIDSAVVLRGQTEAARQVQVRAET
ncbi:MAG: efflux RND transporter periplasmic adaptor subunit, partial [Paracoccaceae bacterium]